MFRALSIGTRLSVGFGLSLALTVGVGVFALFQMSGFNEINTKLTRQWQPELALLSELKLSIAEHRQLVEHRVEATRLWQVPAIASKLEKAEISVETAAEAFRKLTDSDEKTRLLNGLLAQWRFYLEIVDIIFEQSAGGDTREAVEFFQTGAVPILDGAHRRLTSLLNFTDQQGQMAAANSRAHYYQFLNLTTGVLAFAVLGCALAYFWVRRNISIPIRLVSEAMNRLSAGDATELKIDGVDRMDEVGDLLRAAQNYRENLILSRRLAADATRERERLQAAVSNMPVGLSMFSAESKLIISNGRYRDMYSLPADLAEPGTSLSQLLSHRIRNKIMKAEEPEQYVQDAMATMAASREAYYNQVELCDGRSLNVAIQPMPSGGWIAVHEDVTARRESEERIAHMARHDALTELPNRLLFRERVAEAMEQLKRGGKVAILCLDLDQFKSVNDTLGHPTGDALLRAVAARLKMVVREGDTVARLGGDEFAIVQLGDDQPVGATSLAERLIEQLQIPFDIGGHHIVSGTSIGVAIAPMDGGNSELLLKHADLALYRAKQEGRGTYRFFETEMDTRMQERRRLEVDLRQAIAASEFEIYYQPLFNLSRNEISGFEALLRWNHPERGLVHPSDFIPLAEEIGLIIPIGNWVMAQACSDAASWPSPVKLAVNLSPIQFKSSDLAGTIKKTLAASGLEPGRLELEITETVLLNATEAVHETLRTLHEIGVRISMDDFGTGYSSLHYLNSFPFDKIKIDQTFTNGLGEGGSSLAIIRAVAGLGSSLGMETTAEGVETMDQLVRIQAEGCTEVQGYLIGQPQPAAHIPDLLNSKGQFAQLAEHLRPARKGAA